MTVQTERIALELPANYKYLNVLGDCIRAFVTRIDALAERETVSYNIELAVNELFANIAGHAYAETEHGRVRIAIALADTPRRVLIDLYDQGIAFDRSTVLAPDLDEIQIHGYGVFLIETLMDEVHYQRTDNTNHWQLIKQLPFARES